MVRRLTPIVLTAALFTLGAAAAVAASVGSGTYTGTSTGKVDGFTTSHPFSLRVAHGRIVRFAAFDSGNCGTIDDESGSTVRAPITHQAFDLTATFAGHDSLTVRGRFKGAKVSGTLTGVSHGVNGKRCSLLKQTFRAKRS